MSTDLNGRSACQQETFDDRDLIQIQKPAQYMGGERNSVVKKDKDVDVHFALAFPDTYEVGMSHVGLQILYEVLNDDPSTWAERVFMPLGDMEQLLGDRNMSLASLEGRRPLRQFDIVGFSLQYELCATNILTMLRLASIPFFAKDRTEQDPLIIGGGPYTYHPEAISPFFDAFFLGDAEDASIELCEAIRCAKRDKLNRNQRIEKLSEIEGVYVPSRYSITFKETGEQNEVKALEGALPLVTRRLLPTLHGAPFPKKPVVPNIKTVHNRLSVEVMRGCVRGCRFCQAGYLYRPQRERSPEEIIQIVGDSLPETGFEELSLLSLSTADYCSVVPLLKKLMDIYGEGNQLAVSFPSTRVDALTPEVLEQVQRVRRTNFTVAPEGGTQRLRDVINKGVTDDQIIETCSNVFRMGWSGIKMYFMLGLPTETDEDLKGIIDIAKRVRSLPGANPKNITVSVSTHVPKPHTPFQWAEQISPAETLRKQRLLASGLREIGVNFRYHNAFSSFLEGVFCRGDRALAPVVVRAWELGARLDAWSEGLSEEIWMQAFLESDIDPNYYLRQRDVEEHLPWDHLSCGIPKSYFAKEWKRSLKDKTTPDCLKTSCSICGACDYDVKRNVLWPREETEQRLNPRGLSTENPPKLQDSEDRSPVAKIRLEYRKFDTFRFVGHLELVHVFHRSARRGGLPIAYSLGFHPMPRFAFGPPLQLGVSSEVEFVDVYLNEKMESELFCEFLNQTLPHGVQVVSATAIPLRTSSLQESIEAQRFKIDWASTPKGFIGELLDTSINQMDDSQIANTCSRLLELRVERKGKFVKGRKRNKKAKTFILSEFISEIEFLEPSHETPLGGISFLLNADHTKACPRLNEIVNAISELGSADYYASKIETVFKSTPAAQDAPLEVHAP